LSPFSVLPALAVTVLALGLTHVHGRWFAPPRLGHARNASIDGLRGFLALFVFLHHAVLWYDYLRSGLWQLPPSHFYIHLGQSSVALFFMITAFLFGTKLLDARHETAQDGKPMLASSVFWQRLYVSRLLRLTPLYFVVLGVVLVITAIVSDFQWREPLPVLLKNVGAWASFTILGRPDLNGIAATSRMIAGVNWTLPYEWFFYFALPLLALFVRVLPAWPYLLFSAAAIAGLWFKIYPWEPHTIYAYAFIGGIASALAVRWSSLNRLLASAWGQKLGAVAVLLCLSHVFRHYSTANSLPALAWLTVAFAILANGNSLFGLLHSRAAQTLGDASYSIYLLHGLVMYITFQLILGFETAVQLSIYGYWGVILLCTVVLLILSFATFRWIEAPAIRSTPKLSRWIESK
jgi:peptidoglycan/LPS O-acetylase OafA/YrhL